MEGRNITLSGRSWLLTFLKYSVPLKMFLYSLVHKSSNVTFLFNLFDPVTTTLNQTVSLTLMYESFGITGIPNIRPKITMSLSTTLQVCTWNVEMYR